MSLVLDLPSELETELATEAACPATAVRPGTGLLFEHQTSENLIEMILQFESGG